MMIKVGGKYKTKTGECVKIVSSDDSEPYSFLGDNGDWYTKEGRYNSYKETDKDLVEFSNDVVTNSEQPVRKELKLEVGKTYINGYGRKITIVKYNSGFHFYPFVSSEGNTYTKDGIFSCITPYTKDDLIEEVEQDSLIITHHRVYRNGKGENVFIKSEDKEDEFPFVGMNRNHYNKNGIMFTFESSNPLNNLIEEVDDGIMIEVGKTYLNRLGEKIKIERKCDNSDYPFVATEGYFTEMGHYYTGSRSKNDLIEEFVNKDTDTNEKLNFRIGEDYVNRHGQIRTILNYNENEKYCYLATEDETFTKDGEYIGGSRSISNLDLVGLAKPTLKVEVGKTYLNGDGEKVYIMKNSGNSKYPFVSDRTGYIYSPEGYYNINRKTSCDLVCEVKEKPSLGLKVGKMYKTRSCDIVTIVEKRNSGTHPFVSDIGWTYTEDGSYTIGENSSRDIVSRVIKLEVGKEYQTRDGEIVKIIGKTSSCIYPFQSDRGTYTEDGWFTSIREERRQDIVREIDD